MLSLRVVEPTEQELFQQAWDWMHARPDLYSENEGYSNFAEFCNPPEVLRYYGLFQNGALIGLASFRLEGKKACHFGLIAPARAHLRSISTLLMELQRQFFDVFGGEALWISVPADSHLVAQKLAEWFGWKPIAPGLLTFTVFDYLKAQNEYQENATSCATAH